MLCVLGRPYECLGVLRRMARDELPRPISLYVSVMELATTMGAWGNVLDAYLLFEKREGHVFEQVRAGIESCHILYI